jgi:hypothetical protein
METAQAIPVIGQTISLAGYTTSGKYHAPTILPDTEGICLGVEVEPGCGKTFVLFQWTERYPQQGYKQPDRECTRTCWFGLERFRGFGDSEKGGNP